MNPTTKAAVIEALPPLPEPTMEEVPGELWGQNIIHTALFSINQMHEYARAAIALRSEPEPTPEPGERERFEAWASPITALAKEDGKYVEVMTSLAWEAWQARASLPPALKEPKPCS